MHKNIRAPVLTALLILQIEKYAIINASQRSQAVIMGYSVTMKSCVVMRAITRQIGISARYRAVQAVF